MTLSKENLNLPLASIIVPVYNGAPTLDGCLEALAGQTAEANTYEVIVVDDGSSDGSGELAACHGVTVLRQEHAGAAAARNRGARQAQAPILLFTDADCEPRADWVEQMLGAFADPEVAGVKGAYRTRQRSLVARFVQAEYEEKYDRLKRESQIDFVDTHAAGYRADVFWDAGGFDPAFQYDEDQEFSFRVAKAGHKLVFAPAAIVYHWHTATAWRYVRRKVVIGRWKVPVLARHPSKAFRDDYTPWTEKAQIIFLPLTVGLAVAAILDLLPWAVVAIFALPGLLCTLPLTIKALHQGWQVALAAPFLALLRALALGLGVAWGLVSPPRKER